jgi:sec-independent protein translocase protein TatA
MSSTRSKEPYVFAFLEGPDLLIVAVIVLLVFGGAQLPKLARSLGEAQRELKKALADGDETKANGPSAGPSDDSTKLAG